MMSEATVVETPNVNATPETQAPAFDIEKIPAGIRPIVLASRAEYENRAAEADALFKKVQAADNLGSLVSEVRDTKETDDENILAFRNFKEDLLSKLNAAEDKIDAYITATYVKPDDTVDVEKVKAEHKELVKITRTIRQLLEQLDSENATVGLPDVKNVSGRAVSSASGTGTKRPRLSKIVVDGEEVFAMKDEKDGTKTQVTSFTVLAAWLSKRVSERFGLKGFKVEPSVLSRMAFEEAKTDDLSTVNGPIVFAGTFGEGDNLLTFKSIEVTPRQS
jgi:hypothetical protein